MSANRFSDTQLIASQLFIHAVKTADIGSSLMPLKLILFLDIDGVLNSFSWKQTRAYYHIPGYDRDAPKNSEAFLLGELDLTPLALVDQLVQDTHAKVVISSSWRQLYPGTDWLQRLFKRRGAPHFSQAIIGTTPHLVNQPVFCQRGKEVESFLQKLKFTGQYLCIDDCSLHYLNHQPVVETNPGIGFTILDYQDILDKLE